MKIVAVLSLAAMLAAGSATTASAFLPLHGLIEAEQMAANGGYSIGDVVYDPCHGRISGTAHPDCGTATGGPAGGLF